MMLKSLLVGLLLGLSLTIANEAVAAAPDDSGTVTGSGVVLIKRQPEVVRIMVDLSVAGKTAQEAMAALKTRRQASEAKLIDLGATKESIVRGEPHVPAVSDRQRQMEMMVRQRIRAGGKKPAKKTEEQPVTLTASLTAEFPLAAATPDDLLIAAQRSPRKFGRPTSPASSKPRPPRPKTRKPRKRVQPWRTNMASPWPRPASLRFVYVCKISDADEKKALAEAFAKAKAHATERSRAAGAELGSLRSLSGNRSGNSLGEEYLYNGNGMDQEMSYRYQIMQQRAMLMSGDGLREAIGPEPGTLVHAVGVMATFSLK